MAVMETCLLVTLIANKCHSCAMQNSLASVCVCVGGGGCVQTKGVVFIPE